MAGEGVFDREREWRLLADFLARRGPGLAIVRGRRRHGKSVLLRGLAAEGGHFYYQAIRGAPRDQLRDLATAYQAHHGGPLPAFDTWTDAVGALIEPHSGSPGAVIIDELPYLTESSAELESVLQRALDQASPQARPLLVCGSATAIMGRLLTGSAPLRGRAQVELDVGPFAYRDAAAFADLAPEVAFPVHAVVGGVPGYATDLLDRTFPADPAEVERWLVEVVAAPYRPLVHEARTMLDVEPGLRDPSTYLSVVGSVASGATRAGEIAARIGHSSDRVAQTLRSLQALGLVERTIDPLRPRRPTWRIADPLLHFYAAVLRPHWTWVERGEPDQLASRILEPWRAQVLGPHLEHLARAWTLHHASSTSLGGPIHATGPTVVADPRHRSNHQVDVVALTQHGHILALGEAKLRRVHPPDLDRLRRLRNLIPHAESARLLLFSATGFDSTLHREPDVELIDLARLYEAS